MFLCLWRPKPTSSFGYILSTWPLDSELRDSVGGSCFRRLASSSKRNKQENITQAHGAGTAVAPNNNAEIYPDVEQERSPARERPHTTPKKKKTRTVSTRSSSARSAHASHTEPCPLAVQNTKPSSNSSADAYMYVHVRARAPTSPRHGRRCPPPRRPSPDTW